MHRYHRLGIGVDMLVNAVREMTPTAVIGPGSLLVVVVHKAQHAFADMVPFADYGC